MFLSEPVPRSKVNTKFRSVWDLAQIQGGLTAKALTLVNIELRCYHLPLRDSMIKSL